MQEPVVQGDGMMGKGGTKRWRAEGRRAVGGPSGGAGGCKINFIALKDSP